MYDFHNAKSIITQLFIAPVTPDKYQNIISSVIVVRGRYSISNTLNISRNVKEIDTGLYSLSIRRRFSFVRFTEHLGDDFQLVYHYRFCVNDKHLVEAIVLCAFFFLFINNISMGFNSSSRGSLSRYFQKKTTR